MNSVARSLLDVDVEINGLNPNDEDDLLRILYGSLFTMKDDNVKINGLMMSYESSLDTSISIVKNDNVKINNGLDPNGDDKSSPSFRVSYSTNVVPVKLSSSSF